MSKRNEESQKVKVYKTEELNQLSEAFFQYIQESKKADFKPSEITLKAGGQAPFVPLEFMRVRFRLLAGLPVPTDSAYLDYFDESRLIEGGKFLITPDIRAFNGLVDCFLLTYYNTSLPTLNPTIFY